MFEKLKKIYENVKHLNSSVNTYKDETIIQSLPALALVNKAIKFLDKNELEKAKEILLSAQDIYGQDSLVYKYLGKIAEKEHKFDQASEYYNRSSQLNPNDKEIWHRYGMCLLYCDNTDKALEAFEKADKINPMNTDIYTGWGMTLMKQKKYAPARDKFNMASKISKYNFTAILLSAVMEIRLEQYSIAQEKLEFLVKVAPNESSLYEYSHLKLIQNDFDEAKNYALKTIDYNPKMLPAYFILGEIYSVQNDSNKTEDIFNKALNMELECPMLYFEWGKANIRLFEFDKAEDNFNKAINLEEEFKSAKIGLSLVNAYKNNFELLDELCERNLDNVYIQEGLGLKKFSQQDYDEAIRLFKKALHTDKNQTYNYFNIAKSYVMKKDSTKAREYYDKFFELNPKYTDGLLDYSKWLLSVSDYEESRRKLEKAQKLEPENIEVLNLLFLTKYTLVKNNVSEYNIKEAISIAQKAIGLGKFEYEPQKQELEDLLKEIQGKE